jgi:aminoglycoside phosphotransferase family enzyme
LKLIQQDIVRWLKEADVYPHPVTRVKVIETHISWIFLTGRHVYKVKKAVKFGNILDFSRLYLRKKFCEQEVRLNRQLCGNMYQGIVKVIISNGVCRIINLSQKGEALEYAVKMREIPQKYRMDNLLRNHEVTKKTIQSLTTDLVNFHKRTRTNPRITSFGSPAIMKWKINENLLTLSKLTKLDSYYKIKLNGFIRRGKEVLSGRMTNGRIREIHGDLYLKNIFLSKSKFYFYDRIEFNDSLRYADIVEDVAHLAMDLDYHKREDLRKDLIDCYMEKSKDSTLIDVIYFAMCYKSLMRAKVSLFRREQFISRAGEISRRKITDCDLEAREHFALARNYIELF